MKRIEIVSGLVLGLFAGSATAEGVRVFAVAYRHEVARVVSYDTYADSLRAQFEADIAPHLRADAPNLVTYPENASLMAYMIGSRGSLARETINDSGAIAALASLAGPYAPQISYYQSRFPGTSAPGQLLQLGLTDTLARIIMEIYAPLAADYGVYLSVSSNLAAFERIEGGDAAVLADPDLNVDYAYRATAPEILNRNFIFGPDGALITIQDKAYLVPIERDQGAGLGLVGIETAAIPVFDLPFGRVGTVISKDAWMIDANDRLDQLGADLLIQPEAFSTWGVAGDDLWPPDKFQRGGWWMVQKLPAVRANVTPMLTGNLGDLTFDGQPLIAVEAPAGDPALCLMGQTPEPGWAAVGRWADYAEPAADLCGPQRRPELAAVGEALKPGSGDARENAYAEDVVFADLDLPPRPAPAARLPTAARASSAVSEADTDQLQPQLARSGDTTWLTWIDSFGETNQNVALSRLFGGLAWPPASRPASTAETAFDHFDNQWSPAALADEGGLTLAWVGFPTENWDLFGARITATGENLYSGTAAIRIDDAESDTGVTRERGHSSPRLLALGNGRQMAIWSDLRWPFVKPQVRYAISDDGGTSWGVSARADGGPLGYEDEQLDARDPGESTGQSYPDAVALDDGRVLAVWQQPDASGASIIVGRVLDETAATEPLAGPGSWRPRLLADGERTLLIYEQRDAVGGSRLMLRERSSAGAWSAAAPLDPSVPLGYRQRMAAPVLVGGAPWVVYVDNRAGDDDILALRVGDNAPQRIDDRGAIASHSPTAVENPFGDLLVVWQDETEAGPRLRQAILAVEAGASPGGGYAPRGGVPGASLFVLLLAAVGRRTLWRT